MVRQSIYETIQTEHPHLQIYRYKRLPQVLSPYWASYSPANLSGGSWVGVGLVQSPLSLVNRVVFIDVSDFFMYGSGGRLSQSCQYFRKFVDHF